MPTPKMILTAGLVFWALLLTSCMTYTPEPNIVAGTPIRAIAPPPQANKELVAIVGFENKSTYSADKLWETSANLLMSELIRAGYFRVVEWARMRQLFDYDTLSTCSIFKVPEKRTEAQRILLCEYFIMGSVTHFDVSQRSNVSALSKKKQFLTTVRVDLLLQDSQTGEYLSQGSGEFSATQTFSGGLSGGQTGTWDAASADQALDGAIRSALSDLIHRYSQQQRK